MGTAKVNLSGLVKVTSKGKTYYYAWRNGPRIYAEPDTQEFIEEFNSHRTESNEDKTRFAAWVTRYKAETEARGGTPWCELAESTKKNWSPLLDAAKEHFGRLPVRLFDRPIIKKDIRAWRDKWRTTPRKADYAKQVLSRVFGFMVAEGALATNPCEGIENLYSNNRAAIIWNPDDVAALCAVASPEVAWVVRLAALTGLRQGDLLSLKWSEVGKLCIEKRTSKSGLEQVAMIPLYSDLESLLAEIPRRAATVLTTTRGKPWGTGFHNSYDDAVALAGLAERDLHFHDLRGTAATNLYRAGLTEREIAEIVGVSEAEVEKWIKTYVKRDEIIRDRIRKMEHFRNEQARLREQNEDGISKTDCKTDPYPDEKQSLSA
ncbi:MAG TPA: tyrosine-type recombinase/integrase [Rhizomicrobium sp.]|jgi:integrase|nr:tyrosine-type recombinase/integrase [Rhizomicrobium sp.]